MTHDNRAAYKPYRKYIIGKDRLFSGERLHQSISGERTCKQMLTCLNAFSLRQNVNGEPLLFDSYITLQAIQRIEHTKVGTQHFQFYAHSKRLAPYFPLSAQPTFYNLTKCIS